MGKDGAFRLVARIGGREYRATVRAETVIGSAAECDLVLPDPTVSRRHARVLPRDGGLLVQDLESRNGTYVDGARVCTPATIGCGGLLRLGEVELRIEALDPRDLTVAVAGTAVAAGARTAAAAEPTLVSAGISRFCVRELAPLLAALAGAPARGAYAAQVLAALAASAPDAGFPLPGAGDPPLARAGRPGPALLRVARAGLALEVVGSPELAPALRSLAQLGLSLVAAADAMAGTAGTARAEHPTAATEPPAAPQTGDPALREIYWQAARVARSRLNVLLTGESGTGKELLARYLHDASGEPGERYLVLNCAALPADLLDAELFGIEAGVATGVSARPGRFEL